MLPRKIHVTCLAAALAAGAALAQPALAAGDGVTLSEGWMRMIIPSRPAAGYFHLDNATADTVVLTGASSPGCGSVMLHRSVTSGGQARMEMVKSVDVPPHGRLLFSPGGYHLMCMKPTDKMKIGNTVEVTLKFKDGATVTGQFDVKGPAGN